MNKNLIWSIKELPLSLRFTWKISRNSSDYKTNFVIRVTDADTQTFGEGEVAFNVRYNENKKMILSEFERFLKIFKQDSFYSLEAIEHFLLKHKVPASLSFGIESSLTALNAKNNNMPIVSFLGLEQVFNIETSFSIPIMSKDKIEEFILKYHLKRFKYLKIKIGGAYDFKMINKIIELTNMPIRIDANEAFESSYSVLKFIEQISDLNRVEFLEQPLASINLSEQIELKKNCPILLAADESVVRDEIDDSFISLFDIINIKLMKSGSYQKAISQLEKSKELGLQTMLGCMIESSLGISCAINLASLVDIFDLDGFLLINEDPYQLVSEKSGLLNLKEHS